MSDRTPTDGRPYYCKLCGVGFGEYLACEEPDCELEEEEEAEKRVKVRKKEMTKGRETPTPQERRRLRCVFGLHDWEFVGDKAWAFCRRKGCRRVERYSGRYFELDVVDSGWRELWVRVQ